MLFFFGGKIMITIESANFLRPPKDLFYLKEIKWADHPVNCSSPKDIREKVDPIRIVCQKDDMQEYSCQENPPEIGTDKRDGKYWNLRTYEFYFQ